LFNVRLNRLVLQRQINKRNGFWGWGIHEYTTKE
jgi:hypothetical protein